MFWVIAERLTWTTRTPTLDTSHTGQRFAVLINVLLDAVISVDGFRKLHLCPARAVLDQVLDNFAFDHENLL